MPLTIYILYKKTKNFHQIPGLPLWVLLSSLGSRIDESHVGNHSGEWGWEGGCVCVCVCVCVHACLCDVHKLKEK